MKTASRTPLRLFLAPLAVTAACALLSLAPAEARAQEPSSSPPSSASSPSPARAGQGLVVVALGDDAQAEAFRLARALYASRLRATSLDEVRARVLAGSPPPANASRELRELAEVRKSIQRDDAAGRRLLAGIGQQVGAQALVVVQLAPPVPAAPATPEGAAAPAPVAPEGPPSGEPAPASPAPASAAPEARVPVARLFLVGSGEFDAARYAQDAEGGWKGTITSLEQRFPPPAAAPSVLATRPTPPPSLKPEEEKARPFYASGWFWGAIGGALLVGGAFYLATRDTSSDSIHVDMRVPR